MNTRVTDPFNAVADPALPTLAAALNPEAARHEFKRRLPRLSGDGRLHVKQIRVLRHKPGKRCVVEYGVKIRPTQSEPSSTTIIGKVRARRSGNEAFRQLELIWNAGFAADSADGICVPEPIGVVAEFQMWFQRKVPGLTATDLLTGPEGVKLARRIAEAAHKLHQANLAVEREHTMTDELRILRECLAKVAALRPDWSGRLERLMAGAERLGGSFTPARSCGIHRDFYPAQVIVDDARLCLIDFDLFCWGDPGLDIGNFIGHLLEAGLRVPDSAQAQRAAADALADRFVELTGAAVRRSVEAYTTLTLIRHIYLSTQFSERAHTTEALLDLCEARLK